jgi:hypothetical protein
MIWPEPFPVRAPLRCARAFGRAEAFWARCRRQAYAACGPEGADLSPKEPPPLDTRALRPGVSSFLVQRRRDTEARQEDAVRFRSFIPGFAAHSG